MLLTKTRQIGVFFVHLSSWVIIFTINGFEGSTQAQ